MHFVAAGDAARERSSMSAVRLGPVINVDAAPRPVSAWPRATRRRPRVIAELKSGSPQQLWPAGNSTVTAEATEERHDLDADLGENMSPRQ